MHKLSYVSITTGISRTELSRLIRTGRLIAVEQDQTTYIEPKSLEKFLTEEGRFVPEVFKTGKLNILVVDDDENVQRSLKRLFMRFPDVSVTTASNGYEMGRKLNTLTPDIIILDYLMPAMSATDIIKAMSADVSFDKMKVIIFTARDLEPVKEEFKDFPNITAVSKGSDFVALVDMVGNMLK